MAKKERPFNVLMFDDRIEEMNDFLQLAKINRFVVTPVNNTEKGLEILNEKFHRFEGIILDAKSFENKNAVKGTETVRALRNAINGIKEICRKNEKQIPFCVYTGHMDLMGEAWEKDLIIFEKSVQQEEMFAFLRSRAAETKEASIVEANYDVFALWDECDFDTKHKGALIKIFLNEHSENSGVIKTELSNIRPILEGLFWHLYMNGYLIEEVVNRRSINLESCVRLLSGREAHNKFLNYSISENIGWQFSLIKNLTSEMGSHDYEGKMYSYSLKTVLYALCNVLIWYKDFVVAERTGHH